MKYIETIKVTNAEYREVYKMLYHEPANEKECFLENDSRLFTVKFTNGYFMDIKVCGILSFEQGTSNTCWSEAVLFNEKGAEVACTDAGDDFLGEWMIEYSDNQYIVTVEVENTKEERKSHKISSILKRITKHNNDHPQNGILSCEIDEMRDIVNISLGMNAILSQRSLEEAFWVIYGICNYADLLDSRDMRGEE